MVFQSRYHIDIPSVDLLTYLFDTPLPTPDKPLYISAEDPAQVVTRPQLEDLTTRLAAGLLAEGHVVDGSTVLLLAENSIWYPAVVLGTICAGGVFSGGNPGYTVTELAHQITTAHVRCIVADEARLAAAAEAAAACGLPARAVVLLDDPARTAPQGRHARLGSLLGHGRHAWRRETDPAVLQATTAVLNFSSGTTGLPKACMLSHANLVANAAQQVFLDRQCGRRLGDETYATRDVHCAYLPMYHAIGLVMFCLINVHYANTTVVLRRFSLPLLLGSLERHRVTFLLLVPPVAVALIKAAPLVRAHDLRSVRWLLCGAAPLGADTSAAVEALLEQAVGQQAAADGRGSRPKLHMRQGWGMTEATMAVTMFAPDEFDPTHRAVGYLVPNVELLVVDDAGAPVGADTPGQALVRGPNVFRGYYGNAAATAGTFVADAAGGAPWLSTGDSVVVDGRTGLVRIVDRIKELIKVKGFQVAPSELEAHLLAHPAVVDCAVVRVVDASGREHPQAHVVVRPRDGDGDGGDSQQPAATPADLQQFIAGRLSPHKHLTGGVVLRDTIPKSASGKILRRLLVEEGGGVVKAKM